jgi:ABC-type bacteriocin/lantibiotic exporter with double-glycine peptidase domain
MTQATMVDGFRSARLQVPTVLQMEETECGAASLCMVLGYFGKWISLDEARVACNVGRNGVSAAAIVAAAQRYGLEARGLRGEIADLSQFRFPLILFWEFHHFLVLERGTARGAIVNDPAMGRRLISWGDFDLSFTGIALELQPGAEFVPSGARPSLVRESAQVLRSSVRPTLLALLAAAMTVVIAVTLPWIARVYADRSNLAFDHAQLSRFSAGMLLVVGVVTGLLTAWLRDGVLAVVSARLALSMNTEMFSRMMALPVTFFQQRHHGVLAGRFSANDDLAVAYTTRAVTTVSDLLLILSANVLLVAVCPTIGWLAVAATAGAGVLMGGATRLVRVNTARYHQSSIQRRAVTISTLFGIDTIRANGEEDGVFVRWSGALARMANSAWRVRAIQALVIGLPPALVGFVVLIIAAVGGQLMLEGEITGGAILQLELTAALSMIAMVRSSALLADTAGLAAGLSARRDIMTYPLPEVQESESTVLPHLSGRIDVESVTYGFGEADAVLRNVSFSASPGQRIAIVGATGSGKSTLAKILVGLYAPTSGVVLFDGVDRRRLSRSALTGSLSFVEQGSALVSGTVRDNLSLWDPTLSDADLKEAARDAEILDDIMARTSGLDHVMGHDAMEWSGGQVQRLQLARALACKPAILVLDEATSALDTIVEARIYANLKARGCTVIIVAHRLSSIRDADRIVVLERGVVAESGTHAELMASHGRYWEMVQDE